MILPFPRALARPRTIRAFSTTPFRSSSVQDATTTEEKPLYGTAPSHRSYIFLHAPEPPRSFPARHSTPLQRALQLKVMRWGGTINFSWLGPRTSSGQSLTAFSALGGRLEVPELNMDNLDEVAERLERHASEGPLARGTSDEIHLYVCTHGARDCRCGETGGAVFRALQEEVGRLAKVDPFGVASRIKVGEVGHVGGHQYAANMLVYPHGEWLGLLKPEDVPSVLARILDSPVRPYTSGDAPISPSHWRGRMGLAKDEQVEVFESLYPNSIHP